MLNSPICKKRGIIYLYVTIVTTKLEETVKKKIW